MKGIYIKAYMLAIAAIILWATVATAFKLGLQHYTPYQLVVIACVTSTACLFVLSFKEHGKQMFYAFKTKQDILFTGTSSLLNPFLYYLVLFSAYDRLPAQVAQPVNFTWPIFLSVFAILFLKERFRPITIPALLVSFSGVVLLSSKKSMIDFPETQAESGILLGLLSAVIWAVYWIVNLRDKRPALIKLFWGFLTAMNFIIIYGTLTKLFPFSIKFNKLIYPAYIGLFEMSVTFYLWMRSLELAKNTPIISNLVYLTPILSLFFIRIILKESLQSTTFYGLALIISGVILQSLVKTKHQAGGIREK